jgi:hypothetical protein
MPIKTRHNPRTIFATQRALQRLFGAAHRPFFFNFDGAIHAFE